MEKNKLTTSTAEETVTISRTEYESLLEDKRQKEWLLEQLRLARKKKFGSSSEQLTEEAVNSVPKAEAARGFSRIFTQF